MSEVTVRQLADLVGTPVDRLLEQLAEAGMVFAGPDQTVTSTEKVKLLGFLRRAHGKTGAAPDLSEPKQITLKRRKVQELTVSTGARGKPKQTVAVEVRQKRTYVKRSSVEGSVDAEREEAIRLLEESRELQAQEAEQSLQADARRAEEQARERADEEARSKARESEQAQRDASEAALLAVVAPADAPSSSAADLPAPPPGDTPARPRREINKPKPSGAAKDRARGPAGRRNELHLSDDLSKRRSSRRKPRRAIDTSRLSAGQHGFSRPTAPMIREVPIGESIIVSELAQKLAVKGSDVVKALFKMGVMTTINQPLDHDTAVLVVEELGHTAVAATDRGVENELVEKLDFAADGKTRPPIVTVMGHVDHGKTSLLDKIRAAKVATGEAGGITQHIGAYHVETPGGVVTFLDTPGHSAFSSMRARGAKLTDIVVLVVAADDGVKPQTIEALQHAKAAGVPVIVAVNKMDLEGANPENVKQGLSQHGIVPEDWGGETQFVPLSAKTGDGIDSLLESILLQAEVLELTAPDEGRAAGVVVEASLDRGRGPVATVLVQRGQLRQGDFVVCGTEYGRVRALFDEAGQPVKTAGPSIPVQMLGLSGVPAAGDDLVVVDDERLAKDVAQDREAKRRESRLIKRGANRLEDLMAQMGQTEAQQQLNLVIKADVHGSAEALRESLEELSNDRIVIRAISTGVGGITESDATLAATSKALVIGFNVRADAAARRIIESDGLDLRYFSIIYDVIDQVRQVAEGILGTEIREDIIGTADVRDVFHSSKFGSVAGCIVVEGSVRRSNPIRVVRDQKVIFTGELESLRRFKEDVQEVKEGTECGIAVRQYNDVKAGDQIECYERIEVQRLLRPTVKPPPATAAAAEATPEG